jgi:hypothetical protein
MSPPQLVDTLEVGVSQKPRVAGKGGVAGWQNDAPRRNGLLRNIMIRLSRDTGGHGDSKIPDR